MGGVGLFPAHDSPYNDYTIKLNTSGSNLRPEEACMEKGGTLFYPKNTAEVSIMRTMMGNN